MKAIELAIKTETDAIAFYRQAAEKTSHPVGKKMFLSIVEDEQRHSSGITGRAALLWMNSRSSIS